VISSGAVPEPPSRLHPGKLAPELLAPLLAELPLGEGVVFGPGIGRDVAVVDTGGERYWLLKADPVTFATDEIAHYAVTVNANDIATAGGTPRWFLATLLLPERASTPELAQGILRGLGAACRRLGVGLVGGHTEITLGLDRPIVVGAMIGDVAKDRLVRPDGARPGDVVLCTKGVPLEGGTLLAREKREALLAAGFPAEEVARCAGWLHDPGISVVEDARAACGAARVHAMHDPTEGGIATALVELAAASGVGLLVDAAALPVLEPARRWCDHFGLDPLGVIASGALLVAVAEPDAAAVEAALAARAIACARVARVVPRAEGLVLREGGRERPLPRFDQDEITRVLTDAA
jgi:hydrogenase maturation factor